MADFQVTYEVQDGYVGGSRPQHFNIHDGELEDDMSDEQLRNLFWDMVQQDMEQRIHAASEDESAFVEWAKERIAARIAEEEQ